MMCEACWRNLEEHEYTYNVWITRPHEIKSRGTGGACVPENQFHLCKTCHTLWDNIGWLAFVRMYDHLETKARGILGRFWHELTEDCTTGEDDSPAVFI